jgi:hypothetical protein
MRIKVQQVIVPADSTVGYVIGVPVDDGTKLVVAGADRRGAIELGESFASADEQPEVDVPDWAVITVLELP